MAAAHLWPQLSADYIDSILFALTYNAHGGSGLSCTWEDVLNTPYDRAVRMMEKLSEARQRESAAIKAANSAGRAKSKG